MLAVGEGSYLKDPCLEFWRWEGHGSIRYVKFSRVHQNSSMIGTMTSKSANDPIEDAGRPFALSTTSNSMVVARMPDARNFSSMHVSR